MQWIDEETVEPAQLRVWEEEVERSPYICSSYLNVGQNHQKLGAGLYASMQHNTETVKSQVVDGEDVHEPT